MLQIGKVLGTRSALSVSKWSYMFILCWKTCNAFTNILLLSGKVLLKTWFGKIGGKGENIVFRNPIFGFVKVWLLVTKNYLYQFEIMWLNWYCFLREQYQLSRLVYLEKIEFYRNWFDVEYVLWRECIRYITVYMEDINIWVKFLSKSLSVRVLKAWFYPDDNDFTSSNFTNDFIKVLKKKFVESDRLPVN